MYRDSETLETLMRINTTPIPANSIYQTIALIRKEVGAVEKKGVNTFHKYKYATANDIIHQVRDSINRHNLIILPVGIEQLETSKEGQLESFTMLYKLIALDGSFEIVKIRCSGEDKGDKKSYKANTGALKYLFIQVFLLATDDDPENEGKKILSTQNITNPAEQSKELGIDDIKRALSSNIWNGKVYAGSLVYVNRKKYKLSKEAEEWHKEQDFNNEIKPK